MINIDVSKFKDADKQMLYDCALSGQGVISAFCKGDCFKCTYERACIEWGYLISCIEDML